MMGSRNLSVFVYPALQAVAVESQLTPLFLHFLQLLLQLLDFFLREKRVHYSHNKRTFKGPTA